MHLLNDNVANLEGVPHNLNLESGIFESEKSFKEIIDIPVDSEELSSIGILKIEDLLDV